MTLTGERGGPIEGTVSDGPLPVLGVAHYDGPVIIAWDSARAGARHPERGHNVVYHEFAHKLDMLDGVIDGTPPLATPGGAGSLGRGVHRRIRSAARRRPTTGSSTATRASNPAEFFAVATEAFFDLPVQLEAAKPDLYGVLRDFYRQDPARVSRENPAR